MTTLDRLKALLAKAKTTAHHLTNCTDDPADAPWVADCEESMEVRKEMAGDNWSWEDTGIPLRIADDCEFCTVHGFEGQAQWDTAQAISDAGPVILGLINALPDLLAALEAAKVLHKARTHPVNAVTEIGAVIAFEAALSRLATPTEGTK